MLNNSKMKYTEFPENKASVFSAESSTGTQIFAFSDLCFIFNPMTLFSYYKTRALSAQSFTVSSV